MADSKKKKNADSAGGLKKLEEKLSPAPKNAWDELNEAGRREAFDMGRRALDFLSRAKTERATASQCAKKLAGLGLCDFAKSSGKARKGGYIIHQGKLFGAYIPGAKSPAEGFNLIVAHGDSPRLDLKPKCVYEETGAGFGMLKTNLYGGLKKFQWLARPLALWGFCALKDGRRVEIVFGEEPGDPVLTIPDLLPHLDRKVQRDKKISEAIVAEKMNLAAAGIPIGGPDDKNRLKLAVLKILYDRWGLAADDLLSSEMEIVPAGPARDAGLDGSFIGAYGLDDRLAVFAALEALNAVKKTARPTLFLVYDREEIGSYGATGAAGGNFVEYLASRAFEASGLDPKWADVRAALMNSNCLSADVEGAIDPDYKEVHEDLNSARVNHGACLIRYTGGAGKYGASEAGAEYMARMRAAFDAEGLVWQSSLLGKQEEGGGGTEALYMASFGMNVVDCGPPVISMHSPFEIASKADILMTARAYAAFLSRA